MAKIIRFAPYRCACCRAPGEKRAPTRQRQRRCMACGRVWEDAALTLVDGTKVVAVAEPRASGSTVVE